MELIIAVIQNGQAVFYEKPERLSSGRDAEAQLLELKIAFKHNNPAIRENLDFWKKLVEDKQYYGLLVAVDYDKGCVEYLPLKTKRDHEFVTKESKERVQHKRA